MAKQRRKRRISPRTMTMRVDYFQATPGCGGDHTLELVLNGSHNGHIVKTRAKLELGNISQLAGQLHSYVAREQRKVTQALTALQGNNPNGCSTKP